MATEKQIENAKLEALWRFVRTIVPQLPAIFAGLAVQAQLIKDLPSWVIPVLIFGGAVATAVDKFIRQIGGYKK